MLEGFAVVGAVVLVGWFLGRRGTLGADAQRVLARLVYAVGTPALLVRTLSTTDVTAVLGQPLVVSAAAALTAAAVSLLLSRLRRRSVEEGVVAAFSSSYVNAVNLGLPIAVFVLGNGAVVAPALLFQIVVLAPLGVGVLDARRHRAERRTSAGPQDDDGGGVWARTLLRLARNPLVVGAAVGLVLGLLRLPPPEPLSSVLDLLAGTAVPCALLAFGLSLSTGPGPQWADPDAWLAVALKLVLSPLVAWVVGGPLLGLSGDALLAVVLVAALPTAQNVFVYATRFGAAERLARDSVLLSTLMSAPVLAAVVLLLG
ncbi:AEC family transporter [Quadrisphaera setariae]|uniref:AEC family transporter n=1 Tax=Quadrisphaera setariae TaxID=2593304 RepID=A0A5C8ZL96_9ACTN|nr:AEC family transporter [Quadrisphaera setariae]TXR57878.1 AEC family transporter [Quadrisphaera setariae]